MKTGIERQGEVTLRVGNQASIHSAFWVLQWIFTSLWNLVQFDAWLLRLVPYLIIGAYLGVGGFFSFAHLGAKRIAWRALTHLRKSWLSREILTVGLFGAGRLLSIMPLP